MHFMDEIPENVGIFELQGVSYESKNLILLAKSPTFMVICAIGSINSQYFHTIGDGHQPNSRGLYTHYKDSLLKVG